MYLYEKLSSDLALKIGDGTYQVGEKLPSVRGLSRSLNLSITTVLEAYNRLEDQGKIEAKPKSGYFVLPVADFSNDGIPDKLGPPKEIPFSGLMQDLLAETGVPDILSLALAQPEPDLVPLEDINRIIRRVLRTPSYRTSDYVDPKGLPAFRAKIATLMLERGVNISAREILVTNGCQQALRIALECVTKRGDIIAIESPCYPGLLHIASEIGLKVLEIPSHRDTGIDLTLLAQAMKDHLIKALFLTPTSSNPCGSTIPVENRKIIVELASRHKVIVIEDDTTRDLHFGNSLPPTLKSFEEHENIIYCGSFSKTMGPGLRLGWMIPGPLMETALSKRYTDDLGGPSLEQHVLAEFVGTGPYYKALAKAKRVHARTTVMMARGIREHFPEGTEVLIPSGGFLLWVKLPAAINGERFRSAALEEKISIAPGALFSDNKPSKRFVRIGWGGTWTDTIDQAIVTLGKIANRLA